MAETPPEVNALAYIVHQIRPSWPRPLIVKALADDHRDLGTLTRAAVQAATNPKTIHANGIRTTFPGSDNCSVCAERQAHAERNSQPPQIERCRRCDRVLEHGIEHACRSQRPDGWDEYQRFWRDCLAEQCTLREAIANNPDDHDLAVRNRARIVELAAQVDERAAKLKAIS